ncbi:unnamed protein product [Effrenium voratum]|uniref:Aspartate-semialdehyde dehydrogenase n=1 Tax=Effrenium voratum TaxID=2562239 RepID=A0AA36JH67_9DINO|nr:unnamed protein product [Effrenium voratum]
MALAFLVDLLRYSPQITANGKTVVIDNSSAFRYHDDVPLVVPEINKSAMEGKLLVANPNCTTAIAAMALWPLHQHFKLRKVIVSTYQAASGAGAAGMQELEEGTRQALQGEEHKNEVFAHPLPFNVIPHIDSFQSNGYTKDGDLCCRCLLFEKNRSFRLVSGGCQGNPKKRSQTTVSFPVIGGLVVFQGGVVSILLLARRGSSPNPKHCQLPSWIGKKV